jgi:signal transduction histidine kinase
VQEDTLQDESATQLSDMARLHDLSTRLSTRRGLRPVLAEVLATVTQLQNTDMGMLMLYDSEHDELEVETTTGLTDEYLQWVNTPGKASRRLALEARRAVIIEDVDKDPRFAPYRKGARLGRYRSAYLLPLVASTGQIVGTIVSYFSSPHRPSQREVQLVELYAHHAAELVEIAKLCGEVEKEVAVRKRAEEAIRRSHEELEAKVAQRTAQLESANKDLARHAQELTRMNAKLERFAYVASHDLKEPLRMVSSYAQLLGRRYKGRLDADADAFINYLIDGTERMKDLIDALLRYSWHGARGRTLEAVNCEEVLHITLKSFSTVIEEKQAVVTHDPLPTLMADAIQFAQLFQNLIANALKFHGDTPPRVHLSAERHGSEWRFSVWDNGIGIDPEYTERIFVIFQRLNAREEYPGTGIGLAICKEIVEAHGGRIWVESEAGKGSTFYFTIPEISKST